MAKLVFYLLHIIIGLLVVLAIATIQHVKIQGIAITELPFTSFLIPCLIGSLLGLIVAYFKTKIKSSKMDNIDTNNENDMSILHFYQFSYKDHIRTYLKYITISMFIIFTFASYQILVTFGHELKFETLKFYIIPALLSILFGYLLANSKLLMNKLSQNIEVIKAKDKQLNKKIYELENAKQQMIESESMASLGRLVAGIAHEVNTPIGNAVTAVTHYQSEINSFNEQLERGLKKQHLIDFMGDAKETTDIIYINLQRAALLIKSFKQIAVDKSHLDIRDFLLKEYIDEIILSMGSKLKHVSHYEVNIDMDENISLHSYPGAIAQIISNFIDNSLMHGFDGYESGLISISAFKEEKTVKLIYQDNGKGIAADKLNKIYKPFYTSAKHKGGTGLGLSILYNLVTQKLQGKIKIESKVNQGVKFTIEIPVQLKIEG